jgi:pimeloyl-ACP methyl ester carboxylesterase
LFTDDAPAASVAEPGINEPENSTICGAPRVTHLLCRDNPSWNNPTSPAVAPDNRLAAKTNGRSVVLLDSRGFGESDKPAGGYDLDTAARGLHRFLEVTNLATPEGIDIVAHDVETWMAHAHAANYPADVRRLKSVFRSA